MSSRRFTEEIDTYIVLRLRLDEYHASSRNLPPGFELVQTGDYAKLRKQEKKLLQQLFDDWEIPYCRKLPGWRADSPIFVAHGNELVGGAHVCIQNEFDAEPTRGQLHYAFMDPRFQGQGIYSVIFRESVARARAWGLTELYLNSDRYMLPEVYLRWGAVPWKTIEKASRLPLRIQAAVEPLRGLRKFLLRAWQVQFPPCE